MDEEIKMEIFELEYWAAMFRKMILLHPELCPHDYEWRWTDYSTGEKQFRCRICEHTKIESVPQEELDAHRKQYE